MTQDHSYDGDLLTAIDSNSIVWDDNGSMVAGIGTSITRDPESRIRSATAGSDSIDCVYDPDGRMVRKTVTTGGQGATEKYLLDTAGDYPVVLLVLDPNDTVDKSYVHALGQTLSMQLGANRYFYLHDRLGSVRLVLDNSRQVANTYTYDPWGNAFPSETSETVDNELRFANYRWDDTTGMYYLNARWYDPVILRFTGRDPVRGDFKEPLTLHTYLYCQNDPGNCSDPGGKVAGIIGGSFSGNITVSDVGSAFVGGTGGLGGLGAAAVYSCGILPGMVELAEVTNHIGWGGTAGGGFAFAWDHTRGIRGLFDKDAWSWGTIQWVAGGGSISTGIGGSITLDFAISNARHVSQLAGPFGEVGGSVTLGNLFTAGGTISRGIKDTGGFSDIWVATISAGGGTSPGFEGHGYGGYAIVQEHAGWY